jgi:hypothetical protein
MKDEWFIMKNEFMKRAVDMFSCTSPRRRTVSSRTSSFILHPSSFLSPPSCFLFIIFLLPLAAAEETQPDLPLAQSQVGQKYQRFEEVLLRMSELTAGSDPRRASLLRKAVARSKDLSIGPQLEEVAGLLKQEQLATALKTQQDIERDLEQLLKLLLSEERGDRLKSERERIKRQIQQISELIKTQRQLEGQTETTDDPKHVAPAQGKLGEQAGKLADEMREADETDDDKPGNEKPANDDRPDKNRDDKKPEGDKPEGDKPEGDKQEGDKQDGDKPGGDKGENAKPSDADKPPPSAGDNSPPPDKNKQSGKQDKSPKSPPSGKQGQPGESGDSEKSPDDPDQPPPSDNDVARQRVREAEQAMREARNKLEQAERDGAMSDQEDARRKLEQAKAKLEEILRQLREEEVERTLALLEARFRKMLEMQVEVYEGTVRVARVPEADRTHNDEIEAGRLGRAERAVLEELRGAETLLREDGSSVAFPEAVAELRDDMEMVAGRLAESKVDELTQSTEQDIITALEEMIAAFQQAQRENEEKQERSPNQSPSGEPSEPPLVDGLAELRMIRALQMRVNTRTKKYAQLIAAGRNDQKDDDQQGDEQGQAERADLVEALEQLSDREARIHRVTRDIVLGKNQ